MSRRDLTGAVDFPYLLDYVGQDRSLAEEVLGLFEQQCEMWMRLLQPEADPESFRDGAHTLKGASLGIGARTLAEACRVAEKNAGASAAARAAMVDDIRAAADLVLSDIAAWRHEEALVGLKA